MIAPVSGVRNSVPISSVTTRCRRFLRGLSSKPFMGRLPSAGRSSRSRYCIRSGAIGRLSTTEGGGESSCEYSGRCQLSRNRTIRFDGGCGSCRHGGSACRIISAPDQAGAIPSSAFSRFDRISRYDHVAGKGRYPACQSLCVGVDRSGLDHLRHPQWPRPKVAVLQGVRSRWYDRHTTRRF